MKALRAALERVNDSYWADRTEEQMLAVLGWIALKEGARDQAVKFMRAAAENEDNSLKHVAMENRLYPLRELYGDLLLEIGDAAAALTEYETALKATPNRYRGILGVARAADARGDRAKAAEYYGKLIDLAKNEKDPDLRRSAIHNLGLMRRPGSTEALTAIYTSDTNTDVRKAVINALFLQQNAGALITLARAEKSVEMKKEIVQKLALIHSKEAMDYLAELLK